MSKQARDLHRVNSRSLGAGQDHQLKIVVRKLFDQTSRQTSLVDLVVRRRQLLLIRPIDVDSPLGNGTTLAVIKLETVSKLLGSWFFIRLQINTGDSALVA